MQKKRSVMHELSYGFDVTVEAKMDLGYSYYQSVSKLIVKEARKQKVDSSAENTAWETHNNDVGCFACKGLKIIEAAAIRTRDAKRERTLTIALTDCVMYVADQTPQPTFQTKYRKQH